MAHQIGVEPTLIQLYANSFAGCANTDAESWGGQPESHRAPTASQAVMLNFYTMTTINSMSLLEVGYSLAVTSLCMRGQMLGV